MNVLTKTEVDVLKQVAQGLTREQIAERRFRSVDTIKAHMKHVITKLHAKNAVNAVYIANRMGLIGLVLCVLCSAFSDDQVAMRRVRMVRSFRLSAGRVLKDLFNADLRRAVTVCNLLDGFYPGLFSGTCWRLL